VRRVLPLLLLLGALIGLLGQGTAYARGPQAPQPAATVAAIEGLSAECMEMMRKQPPAEQPCEETFDCIMAMGCTIPLLAAPELLVVDRMSFGGTQHFVSAVTPLSGRSFGPEPEPPTRLI
jgi:hypothetical protein